MRVILSNRLQFICISNQFYTRKASPYKLNALPRDFWAAPKPQAPQAVWEKNLSTSLVLLKSRRQVSRLL